jgi:hypothetical protein
VGLPDFPVLMAGSFVEHIIWTTQLYYIDACLSR